MGRMIDYSTSRPTTTALHVAGITAVGRYIGWDSVPGFSSIGKNITRGEAITLLAGKIEIFLAFEYAKDAAAKGTSQGTSDGQLAMKQLGALDAPPTMAVYFCVDYDIPDYAPSLPDIPANALAKLGPVGHYFQAINALKYPYEVGGYGGYWAIKRLFDARLITKGWQTSAWSGGHLDSRTCIYQIVGNTPIFGADPDIREHGATDPDFGQWPRPLIASPSPAPSPTPVPSHTQGEDMVYVLDSLATDQAVVIPVPAGATKVIIYTDYGFGPGHTAPLIRVGSSPKWALNTMAPVWNTPSEWAFPPATKAITVGRSDPGNTPVTVAFA